MCVGFVSRLFSSNDPNIFNTNKLFLRHCISINDVHCLKNIHT